MADATQPDMKGCHSRALSVHSTCSAPNVSARKPGVHSSRAFQEACEANAGRRGSASLGVRTVTAPAARPRATRLRVAQDQRRARALDLELRLRLRAAGNGQRGAGKRTGASARPAPETARRLLTLHTVQRLLCRRADASARAAPDAHAGAPAPPRRDRTPRCTRGEGCARGDSARRARLTTWDCAGRVRVLCFVRRCRTERRMG